MSSAGQANEAGSVFRRDAAVYFAVHALAGFPIHHLDPTRLIARIDFETSDPTDDIVLTFTDGAKAYVAAKNAVQMGKSFIEPVAGWVAQMEQGIGPSDLLALTFARSAAWVGDLSTALIRARAGQALERPSEIEAIARLHRLVPGDLHSEVNRRARLVQVSSSPVDGDVQSVLRAIMDNVVEDGMGASAASLLASHLHKLAGQGLGADISDLVELLVSKDLKVAGDKGGSPAARSAASRAAIEEYQDALTSEQSKLNLFLLADDLDPIVVPGLLKSIRVVASSSRGRDAPGKELGLVLRRHRRLLLVGQPGSGKSVAIREIAAACATDPDAPFPVRLKLPDLLSRVHDRELTVADLIDVATLAVSQDCRALVGEHMRTAFAGGNVMLVLDGLDECRDRAPEMVQRLKPLIASLHHDAGVVVATRASVEKPAERLGLPRVDLQRPQDLDTTMDALLVQCAEVRVPADVRDDWLATRRRWIREVREAQAGLIEVPQLALLVVLIVAQSPNLDIPKERAALLHTAVRQAVERWDELNRFKGEKLRWASEMTPDMLLDGFVLIGRALDASDSVVTKAIAEQQLAELLTEHRWNLPGGRAEALAREVLRFWDEHVAVFTLDEHGILTSRSRVFVEVATAMWTVGRNATELQPWLEDAVLYDESDGVLQLALGLNPELVALTLTLGQTNPEATLALADAFEDSAISLEPDDIDTLLSQLQVHIRHVVSGAHVLRKQNSRDPDDFIMSFGPRDGTNPDPLLSALCRLELGPAQRQLRRAFVEGLQTVGLRHAVPLAWLTLVDAAAESRYLLSSEIAEVQDVIDLQLPASPRVIRESRRRLSLQTGEPLPDGIGSVALLAIPHMGRLRMDSDERIYRIAQRLPSDECLAIEHGLRSIGVDTERWAERSAWRDLVRAFSGRDFEEQFLRDIASLHAEAELSELSPIERWSLGELGDLIDATGYPSVGTGDFNTAFEKDSQSTRRLWLGCLGSARGIDTRLASSQARFLLEKGLGDRGVPQDWWLLTISPPVRRGIVSRDCLTAEQQDILIEVMGATSNWLAWNAAHMLVETAPHWDAEEFFKADRTEWKPFRAMLFHLVAILASGDPELLRLAAASEDPSRRRAAANALKASPNLDLDLKVANDLARDPDLSVRVVGGTDGHEPPPIHWTCNDCGHLNGLATGDCAGCETGSRPFGSRADD